MKPARGILVLSILLAVACGWILFSIISRDKALEDAKDKTKVATELTSQANAQNKLLAADKAKLQVDSDAKDAELAQNKALLAQQGIQIASLKATQGKATEVAGAVVSEGADVEAWYKAGSPVVQTISIPALSQWYALGEPKISVENVSILELKGEVAIMGPQIGDLTASNADLSASRDRFQALDVADRATIVDLGSTITQQGATLTLAQKDLGVVMTDLGIVTRSADTWKYVGWTAIGAAAGAVGGAAISGKAGDALIGAGAGAGVGFLWHLVQEISGLHL